MENQTIKSRVQQALDCVRELDAPYREIAFRVILERLLRDDDGASESKSSDERRASFPPINEFYADLNLKAYTDSAVAIAYYLLHAEGIPLFTIQEVSDRLSKCRAEKPKNLSDVLAGCARNGWLAEGDSRRVGMKSWYLTSTGEKYFEAQLKSA